jgi:hypothetical protein
VPPAERESQSEGDRPSGSTSSLPPLPVPSSRGHLSRGSSTSSRGRLTLIHRYLFNQLKRMKKSVKDKNNVKNPLNG